MLSSRERVLKALSFEETDRVPMDLSGMLSTSISCFAYPGLVKALGLPERRVRVYDTGQMLALPDIDVLDALGCDVVTVFMDVTNAYGQPELWHPYDFNGRLDALVLNPKMFQTLPDGTIIQPEHGRSMPPASHVFESEHAGQLLELSSDIPKPNLKEIKDRMTQNPLRDDEIKRVAGMCKRVRESSDLAVFFNGIGAGIGIAAHTGIAMFPMLCLTEPEFVTELHELIVSDAIHRVEVLLPEIKDYIDIYNCSADDWGTQNSTVAAPRIYQDLFQPFYRRFTDAIHRLAPNVKAFLHSCGAIYDILDMVIDSGFDILNPVQWTAGGHSYQEWKDKARKRITLWGGGVHTQETLPLGTAEQVAREVDQIVRYMRQDGGFVFCAIHNILAEIAPENVIAMYRAAAEAR
ncbi:MAG TPA: uroporphyrinogen decarboxylase family protein [Candidatus Hydrogenedentes bacterium]|nr:uroporphyrinogen decarboxylase family protein [Candidatus Hydrogenedentota bacterium]